MAEKPVVCEETPRSIGGKRGERSSSSSSPEIPPNKTAKTSEYLMSEQNDLAGIWSALNKIQRNTDELLKENRALRNLYNELQKSLEFHVSKVESLETKNEALKTEVNSLKRAVRKAEDEIDGLYQEIDDLTSDLGTAINQFDDLEQYTRKHNLEIHGISESPEENVAEKVIKLAKVVNVHITDNDIDICHRMSSRRPDAPKPIIVRFQSYRAKSELYKARKHLKSVSLKNFFNNTDAVYINENLTNYRRDLFAKARKFKKDHNWQNAWTVDGKIFIRKSQSDPAIRIYNAEDLRNCL